MKRRTRTRRRSTGAEISLSDALTKFEDLCKGGNFDGALSAASQIRTFLAASGNLSQWIEFSWSKLIEADGRSSPRRAASALRDAVLFARSIPPEILLHVANLIDRLPAATRDYQKPIRRYVDANNFVARVEKLTESFKQKKVKGPRQAAFEKIASDDTRFGDRTAAEKAFTRAKTILKSGQK